MKKLLLFLILVAVCFAGGAYWYNHAHHNGAATEEGFTVASADYGTMTETISATGLLQPKDAVAVGSPLSGQVVEMYPAAEVGKVVEEGQPLLKLDDHMARMTLDEARTAVRLAEADVKRAELARDAAKLRVTRQQEVGTEVGTRAALDQAKMELDAAEQMINIARIKVDQAKQAERKAQYGLDLTVVRATPEPSGTSAAAGPRRRFTILERKVVLGQLIGPPASAQLFTLAADLSRMEVHAQVSENDIGKIRAGLEATFTVYAYSEEDVRFKGKVTEIRPVPTNLHGAVFYDTLIDVTNERDPRTREWRLRPGMTASVDIVLRQHKGVWKIPTAALGFQLDEHYQNEDAKAKLARWQPKENQDDWRPVWVRDGTGKPQPVFVRIGGKNSAGETGIKEGEYNEVVEWDPELKPQPDPKQRATWPQVITGAPPVGKKGLFDRANVKVF